MSSLQFVIPSNKPVLIKVSAPGCGPCKSYEKVFDSFQFPDKISLCLSDDEVYEWLKTVTDAKSVPITMLFKGGKKVAEEVGPLNLIQLINMIEEGLNP